MRLICHLSMMSFVCLSLVAEEYKIGEEYVLPLKYPKFSVSGNYDLGRHFHGFADQGLRFKLPNQFGGSLAFEAGLYEYFNAGAQLTFNIPGTTGVPIQLGLSLFAKPYLPLNQRCSLFARVGAGISAAQGNMKSWLMKSSPEVAAPELERVYGEHGFFNTAYGGNAFMTLGIELFPWQLFGFALEGGFRSEIWSERGATDPKVPNNFNYFTYEFPLTLMIHIIL